jgi:glycosyltransferase involved in cell wall biosynthesis
VMPATTIRRVRILIVSPSLGLGGAERLAVTYAESLQQRGSDVTLAYGHWPGGWFETRVTPAVEVRKLTDLPLSRRSFPTWRRSLRTLGLELNPDVVFAHSVTAVAVAAAALPRVPRVVLLHGIADESERLAAYVLRASRARALAVSDQTADGIRRYRGAPDIEVVRSGVDLAALEHAAGGELELQPAAPRFLFVGRFWREKATDVLIDAFAQVVQALPEAALVCAGNGPELEARKLQVATLGIDDRVHFVGPVPNVADYIRASDLFVLASRREGLPLVLLESLALGLPAVATRVDGVPLVVRDGDTGWLVPAGDASALAERMIEAASDPRELRRRGEAGARLIRENFSAEQAVERIDAVLRDAAARR